MDYVEKIEVHIIANIRKQFGYSLENVADYLGISKSEISRMENGKRRMPRYVFGNLTEFFGIKWNENIYEHLEKEFEMIYLLLYEMDKKCALQKFQELIAHNVYFKYSKQYYWWLFIEYFGDCIFYHSREIENLIDRKEVTLLNNLEFFPDWIQIVIQDMNYYRKDEYGVTPPKVPMVGVDGRSIPYTMHLYHRYQKYVKAGKYYESIELFTDLENRLKEHRNFKRLIELDVLKSILFTRIGNYTYAERLLSNAYDLSKKINYQNPERNIIENLIWNSIRSMNFDKTLKYCEQAIEAYPDYLSDSNIVLAPYCSIRLGRLSEAKKTIEWFKKQIVMEPTNSKLLLMIEDLANSRNKMFIRHSENCLKEVKKSGNIEVIKFIIDTQIYFYEEMNDWQNAYLKSKYKNEFPDCLIQ